MNKEKEKIKCPYTYDPKNIGCIVCMVEQHTSKCPGYIKRRK